MNKQLKDYTAQPDPEVWNRIENTLHRRALLRRWTRIGAGAAAAAIVAAIVLIPAGKPASSPAMPVITTPGTTQLAQVNTEATTVQSSAPVVAEAHSAAPAAATPSAPQRKETVAENKVVPTTTPKVQTIAPANTETPVAVIPMPAETKPAIVSEQKAEPVASMTEQPDVPVTQDQTAALTEPQHPAQKATTSGQDDTILWIPNAFAPASDDASITIFRPRLSRPGETLTDYRLAIFNRRGMQVFHTNSLDQGWNGTYNGRPLPQGAYVYVIYYTDKDHIRHQRKGTVTLIR